MTALGAERDAVELLEPLGVCGSVAALRGLTLLVDDLPLPTGALVRIGREGGGGAGEVVGFEQRRTIVMPLGSTAGVRCGERVEAAALRPTVRVGRSLLGRVVNAFAEPIDGRGRIIETSPAALDPPPVSAMERRRIDQRLPTGVRAIDLMTTAGRGQRLGVFAGPGVGKSTLLGQIARRTEADVNVLALVGERGREVRDFIETALGPDGLARSVVVVATSDESPLLRLRAVRTACAVAERFRDEGADVMLLVDSITRFAQAQRQVGLATGEPPATRGYTPSVFAALPQLLERAGALEQGGSITGFYTILVEGDDMTEPIADAARGVLDGHVILSRALAQRGHFPAVDVLDSVSRVAPDVCDAEHLRARGVLVRLLAAHAEVEELIQIGAYARGSNPHADVAIELKDRIDALLRQAAGEGASFEEARAQLIALASEAEGMLARFSGGGMNAMSGGAASA